MTGTQLTVLSVAYSLAPVGAAAVGGAEQVLSTIDAALMDAGHRSVVVAQAGSATRGTLWPVVPATAAFDDVVRARAVLDQRDAIARALDDHRVDIVHLHGVDFYDYVPTRAGIPVLATLHMTSEWYPDGALAPRSGVSFNAVSRFQADEYTSRFGVPITVIENGVAVDRLRPVDSPRQPPYAVALGRICPEKGYHLALDAARLAAIPLLLAGRVFPYETHLRYFAREIRPRLDRERRFVGPARFHRKHRLLAHARCLLVPSLTPETSSLVAMEALACGTPVIAFPAGALRDIVQHGVTGFLVENEREMADAIEAAGDLDRAACRHAAEARFSARAMTTRYLQLYEQLACHDVS